MVHQHLGQDFRRLWSFHRDPLKTLSQIARAQGPLASFHMGPWAFVLVSGGAQVHTLLNTHGKHLIKGPGMDANNPLIGRGPLVAEGDLWKMERLAIQPAFDHGRFADYGTWITQATRDYCHQVIRTKATTSDHDMLVLTMRVVLGTLFQGDASVSALQEMAQAVQTVMTYFYQRSRSVLRWPYTWRVPGTLPYHRAADRLQPWMAEFLQGPRKSLVAERLHQALPDDPDAVLQTALTLIMAGHETTGHALFWTLLLLAANPAVQARLQQEVDDQLRGQCPQISSLDRLPYLKAVILESLRLFPPVWLLSRSNPHPLTLEGETFAPRTFFLVSPYVTHHLSSEFPNPDDFDPERWLQGDQEAYALAFLPFGKGPRSCIGRDFALLEMQLVIASFVQALTLHPISGISWRPVPRLSLLPPPGMRLTVSPRST
ncbi:MAG: cytochrome P450 [Sulfobacillus thermotolerans]|nr:cytochrome P450 [Sulfobacillus thermotolerans]